MGIINEYYDARNDRFNQDSLDNTRRVHLTLRHLNKLRKKRELNKLENEIRKQRLEFIYGSGEGDEGSDLGL
jgi:hypothetical protein